jgi:hypothetical protein
LDRALEALADRALRPDFVSVMRSEIERLRHEGDDLMRYSVKIPKAVWHRYAQRARTEHRRISALLMEAVVAQDERIERSRAAESAGARTLDELLRDQRDLMSKLGRQVERLERAGTKAPAAEDPVLGRVSSLEQHARAQGTALAALLMIMDARKWIPKPLAEQLRKERWL